MIATRIPRIDAATQLVNRVPSANLPQPARYELLTDGQGNIIWANGDIIMVEEVDA